MWPTGTSKVLIIEDCINSVLTLTSILKDGNFSILSCCGNQGVEVAMQEDPDVILLEILLENRNGFELLRTLKSNMRTKHIPVIVVTRLNTQEYWDESYRLGASGYIVKPDHYKYLLNKIDANITLEKKYSA